MSLVTWSDSGTSIAGKPTYKKSKHVTNFMLGSMPISESVNNSRLFHLYRFLSDYVLSNLKPGLLDCGMLAARACPIISKGEDDQFCKYFFCFSMFREGGISEINENMPFQSKNMGTMLYVFPLRFFWLFTF